MSYKVKSTIMSLVIGVLLMAAYGIYAAGKVNSGAASMDDLKFWASSMLLFIGVAATIVMHIILSIVLSIGKAIRQTVETGKTDDKAIERSLQLDMVEDEMDKLISLKSMRVGYAIGGLGFIAALISLVMGSPSGVMLNIMFGSFFSGSLIESLAQLVYYRRGIKNS